MISHSVPFPLFAANECLVLLLRLGSPHASSNLDPLVEYVDLLQSVDHLELLPQHHLASLLSVLVAFVRAAGTHLPLKFVSRMFDVDSVTRRLRSSPSFRVRLLLTSSDILKCFLNKNYLDGLDDLCQF